MTFNKFSFSRGIEEEKRFFNVFDLETKKIVFTGDRVDVERFLGCPLNVHIYVVKKCKFKKKYAIRYKKPKS